MATLKLAVNTRADVVAELFNGLRESRPSAPRRMLRVEALVDAKEIAEAHAIAVFLETHAEHRAYVLDYLARVVDSAPQAAAVLLPLAQAN